MKKMLSFILAICLSLSLTACSSGEPEPTSAPEKNVETNETVDTDTEWAIYWYLCGSDLETNFCAATNDLMEMQDVKLPENVQIVIQTGGAQLWQNDIMDSSKLQRYIYDSEGLRLVEEQPLASMGEARVLEDFLAFAKKNFPAKRTMVNFWNHGGGSVNGAAFDELFQMDSLHLDEMYSAFIKVFGENPDDPPVDIIGFDTCLMATVDVAYTFSDIAKYLVASQELEPGNGWLYSGWIGAIAQNPQIEPFELAKTICDTYKEGCELVGTEESITLSVTNLSKVNKLISAYNDFGKEALARAVENPAFFNHFSRVAAATENYGGNTREQGYTNMVDIGHLARGTRDILPETSQKVLDSLADCVEYKINGKYRQESTGLSCYFSYNGDVDDFLGYASLGAGKAFKYFYAYGLTGELSEEGMKYIAEMGYDSLSELVTLEDAGWEDAPVTIDSEGCATLDLGPEANDVLSGIYFRLYYFDNDEDIMLDLGRDNDIIADWDNGIFKDNFRGVWGGLDGHLVYMELDYEGDDYNLYCVPVLLNGEEYNLMVVYDFTSEKFEILGARKGLDDSGAADKNLRYLVEGDKIETIHYASSISDEEEDFTPVVVDTISVTDNISFEEIELGDGNFILIYEMVDSQNNRVYSQPVTIECVDGEIILSVE